MAGDLHTLVTQELGIKESIHLVGHDIGSMIAHAYASQYPDQTASLCIGEAPLPGSAAYHERKISINAWHYSFHSVDDLPELLVEGREKIYLKHFYDRLSQNPDAISNDDLAVYAQAYSQPGALRCGFNVYRAFEQDGEMNNKRVSEQGKCWVRCLALWGEKSYADEAKATEMVGTYYQTVEFAPVKGSGHWLAEENPGGFVDAVLKWVAKR
jgi:pimeloyl-ACP methyl ester carboxylesterase